MSNVRTRIPPSPTGQDLHIGNVYTALMNFAYARKHNGKFIIRIEDTDRTRYQEGSEERILASLKRFGLDYDESTDIGGPFAPYRQSERLPIYKKYAEELIAKGAAYYCFCSKDRLDAIRQAQIAEKKTPRYDKHCLTIKNTDERIAAGESYVVRLNVPANVEIYFEDIIRGEIRINSNDLDDQVLLKSDGYPTYHLGVVVDDHLMEITHIVRAEEWISSTPKHVLLYNSFGWEMPYFAHLPIIRNPDKSKLSKRKNPVWASWYIDEGYLPEAVINYLALLGWSHPEEKEIFTLSEFIQLFDLKDVKPVGPVFDLVKLTWMNQQYIQNLPDEDLRKRIITFYPTAEKLDKEVFSKLLPLLKTRLNTLKEFASLTEVFFDALPEVSYSDQEKSLAKELHLALSNIDSWTKEAVLETMRPLLVSHKIRMSAFYKLFIGRERGLPLPDILELLGKEKSLHLLKRI